MRARKPTYRSRFDIFASILQAVEKETSDAGVTRLMYKSFLSYNQVNQYIGILKEAALLNYDMTNKKYAITAKGLKFLDLYSKMGHILKITEPEF